MGMLQLTFSDVFFKISVFDEEDENKTKLYEVSVAHTQVKGWQMVIHMFMKTRGKEHFSTMAMDIPKEYFSSNKRLIEKYLKLQLIQYLMSQYKNVYDKLSPYFVDYDCYDKER